MFVMCFGSDVFTMKPFHFKPLFFMILNLNLVTF